MARIRGEKARGGRWSEAELRAIWAKARPLAGYDASQWRIDALGHPIRFDLHAKTDSKYAWEVDHIRPVAASGGDEIVNLQPLQWEANRDKGDAWPWSARGA